MFITEILLGLIYLIVPIFIWILWKRNTELEDQFQYTLESAPIVTSDNSIINRQFWHQKTIKANQKASEPVVFFDLVKNDRVVNMETPKPPFSGNATLRKIIIRGHQHSYFLDNCILNVYTPDLGYLNYIRPTKTTRDEAIFDVGSINITAESFVKVEMLFFENQQLPNDIPITMILETTHLEAPLCCNSEFMPENLDI